MPIEILAPTCRLDQRDFARIAYEVMGCVFEIHNDFGRFFDERIYKHELSRRYPGTQLEVRMSVTFEDFVKDYYLDVLVEGSAVFEFKSCESLNDRHQSQLLNYLMMADLPHGKLVNMRTQHVQHKFVNAILRPWQRREFEVIDAGWQEIGNRRIRGWYAEFLHDVGTCLDSDLYEAALIHLLGGKEQVLQEVKVFSERATLGPQKFRLVAPRVAMKVTTFLDDANLFQKHMIRLLEHTDLEAIQWINIARDVVSFQTIVADKKITDKKIGTKPLDRFFCPRFFCRRVPC